MTTLQKINLNQINVGPTLPRETDSTPASVLNQADSFQEKAVLTTLLALDKASFISPFRWFLPTASENGQRLEGGLAGCGGETEVESDFEETEPSDPNACLKDVDCEESFICKEGQCTDPREIEREKELEICRQQAEICDGEDNNCDNQTDEEACGDKVGDPCSVDPSHGSHSYYSEDCVTTGCIHPSEYPNGYCSDFISSATSVCSPGTDFRKSVCVQESRLGVDSNFYAWMQRHNVSYCVVTCNSDSECRTNEDYVCKQILDSAYKACLPRHEEIKIGEGACAQ